ncbi:MAG: ArnT family glycosyltransferase [Candidatus Omnitrophota bacterium]
MKKSHWLAIMVLGFLITAAYWGLPAKQFIGDEWDMLAETIHISSSPTFLADIFRSYTHHFWPLYYLFNSAQYRLFGLNPAYYALAGIGLHLLSSLLVYWLGYVALKSPRIALAAAVIFGLASPASEMITSAAVYPNNGVGVFFALLSAIFFLKKLKCGNAASRRRFYVISLGMLFIALLFGEWQIFLFPVFLLWEFWYGKFDMRTFRRAIPLMIVVGLFLLIRAAFTLTQEARPRATQIIGASGYPVETLIKSRVSTGYTADKDIGRIFYKTVNYPAKIFAQEYLPRGVLTAMAKLISANDTVMLDRLAGDYLSIGLSFLFLGFVIWFMIFLRAKGLKEEARNILLFLGLTIIALMPFVIPAEVHTFLESRYYYQPAVGSSLLLSMIIFYAAQAWFRRPSLFAGLILSPLLIMHFYTLRLEVKSAKEIGALRKQVLETILNTYPRLDKRSVFYIESNQKYFGLDEFLPPFDYGFGHILLTAYYDRHKTFSREFFNVGKYFRRLNSEGYLELDGWGFGYFRHLGRLLEAVGQRQISRQNVYAFSFDGESNTIRDKTPEVRRIIAAYKRNLSVNISSAPQDFQFEFVPLEFHNIDCIVDGKSIKGVYFETKFKDEAQKLPLPFARVVKDCEAVRTDSLYTVKAFRHYGWVGPLLVYYVLGNDSDTLVIPAELYGFKVVSINSVTDLHSGKVLSPKQTRKNRDGSWTVALPQRYSAKYSLEFRLSLAAVQIDIDSSLNSISSITATEILVGKGNGKDKKIILSGKGGRISSFRNIAYVDGVMQELSAVNCDPQANRLEAVFAAAPMMGTIIEMPVAAELALRKDASIKIAYSGYKQEGR